MSLDLIIRTAIIISISLFLILSLPRRGNHLQQRGGIRVANWDPPRRLPRRAPAVQITRCCVSLRSRKGDEGGGEDNVIISPPSSTSRTTFWKSVLPPR